jgi:hypothetical protein
MEQPASIRPRLPPRIMRGATHITYTIALTPNQQEKSPEPNSQPELHKTLESSLPTKPLKIFPILKKSDRTDIISLPKTSWLTEEDWKISTVSDKYFISNKGRCYSEKTNVIMSSKPNKHGYVVYDIVVGDKKHFPAHFLVMEAFVGPRPAKMFIDHKDHVRHNNCIDNLRYVTIPVNNLNRLKSNRKGKPLAQMDWNGNTIKVWEKVPDAAAALNVNEKTLASHCRNNTTYAGYKWQYVTEDLEGEIWKTAELETGTLEISNIGRVKVGNFNANYGTKTSNGYLRVMVGQKEYPIHRLVCEYFNGPCPFPGAKVNHRDECPTNNKANNLNWLTSRENTEYSCGRPITQYKKTGEFLSSFPSIIKASEATGIDTSTIGRSCMGQEILRYDFVFRYQGDSFDIISDLTDLKKGKPVMKCTLTDEEVKRYTSVQEASRDTMIDPNVIRKNIGKPYRGFKWVYIAQ